MSAITELRARLAAGEPLEALVEAALLALNSAEAVADEPKAPAAALAALRPEWEALEACTRAAWATYPEFRDSGAHGMRPDPRAIELYATLTYLARAGIYRPEELQEVSRQDDQGGSWVARESLRLRVLLVCLQRLMADLDSGAVSPFTYGAAVRRLAEQIGQARVAWS